ncbi:MAG: hypothetical protein WEE89_18070 [Gemmatimonadota bacterium]
MRFRVEALAVCFLAVATGCANNPSVQVTPSPGGCCLPPQDAQAHELYYDALTARSDGPSEIGQDGTLRVIVYNVNPLLYQYEVAAMSNPRAEGLPADFFKWWFGGFPQFTALPAAERIVGVPLPQDPNKIALIETRCPDTEDAVTDIIEELNALDAGVTKRLTDLKQNIGNYDRSLEEERKILLSANTDRGEWRRAVIAASAAANAGANEMKHTAALTEEDLKVFDAKLKRARADEQTVRGGRCVNFDAAFMKLAQRQVEHTARLEELKKQLPPLMQTAERYASHAADPSVQYVVFTADRVRRPSDVTITISRRRLETNATLQPVAKRIVNVGGEPMFHIGAGMIVSPLPTRTYEAAKRTVFDPITGSLSEKRVIAEKSAQNWRLAPMLLLSANGATFGDATDSFFSFGVGVDLTNGKADVGYYVGVGGWIADDIGLNFGVYAGPRSRLARGQAPGELLGDNANPTMDETLDAHFGVGLSYRIR